MTSETVDARIPATVPAISLSGLNVAFHTRRGTVRAASDVALEVRPGEMLALLGESGSGKSVTAKAIMGLLRTSTAQVDIDHLQLGETDLMTLDETAMTKIRGERISLVFQEALSALNPVQTVGQQIAELFRIHRGASRKAARAEALELLRMVGIPSPDKRIDDHPHQFSGGMRQRILIAIAIALRPEVLIADEPTTALDVTVQAQILDLLDSLREQLGMAVILITHDLAVVAKVADRVAVMYGGRIVETASVHDVFARPGHPYTEALLRSVPRLHGGSEVLDPIAGSPPSPANLPSGCAFNPRCDRRIDICTEVRPPLDPIAPGRLSACHLGNELITRD